VKVIWKVKLTGADQEFEAPAGGIALNAIMERDGQPVVYLLCDRQTSKAKHQIRLFATGANIPDDAGQYVGMLSIPGPSGPFVAHIFHRQLGVITIHDKSITNSAPATKQ